MHNFVLSSSPSVFSFELVASDNVKYRINMEKNRRGLSASILVYTFITSESILVDTFFTSGLWISRVIKQLLLN